MADAGLVDTLLRRVEEAEDGVDSLQVAGSLGLDHQAVVGAVKSLIALGEVSSDHLGSGGVTGGPTDATDRVIITQMVPSGFTFSFKFAHFNML